MRILNDKEREERTMEKWIRPSRRLCRFTQTVSEFFCAGEKSPAFRLVSVPSGFGSSIASGRGLSLLKVTWNSKCLI
jgi:hypothetical protein